MLYYIYVGIKLVAPWEVIIMEKDYKKEIIEIIEKTDSKAFQKLVYNFIIAVKKKWGI